MAVQLLHGSKVYTSTVVFQADNFPSPSPPSCCCFVIVVIFPGRGVDGVGNNVSAGAGVDRG